MNTLFTLPALRARSMSSRLHVRSAERLSFKSAGRFTCRRLTFTVKSRATSAAGYHSLNDALRIYGTRAGTCFSCSWLFAIFIRICALLHTRVHASRCRQIESQLIMKYRRCVARTNARAREFHTAARKSTAAFSARENSALRGEKYIPPAFAPGVDVRYIN